MNQEIVAVPEIEVTEQGLPKMLEIRFDCLLKMYDTGTRITTAPSIIPFMYEEKPQKPQWFRSTSKLTLESVKHLDPYDLGLMIKRMYTQLELHIKKYEDGQIY